MNSGTPRSQDWYTECLIHDLAGVPKKSDIAIKKDNQRVSESKAINAINIPVNIRFIIAQYLFIFYHLIITQEASAVIPQNN